MVNFGPYVCAAFVALWLTVLQVDHATLSLMLATNAFVQVTLFAAVACIPFLRSGRISYVDIAWPFGVALIGVQIVLLGDGDWLRRVVTGAVYLMIGLRMGIGAVTMGLKTGVIFKFEFPRYEYRHVMLKASGTKYPRFHALAEILAQGLGNASVLALPGFMLAVNGEASLHALEVLGLVVWGLAYMVESTADAQKMLFISKKENKGKVCNIGLWRYSRHPNYFGEWLVWTGLVVAAVPSWLALQASASGAVWVALGVGAVGASAALYTTLVYLTGAVPAEYFSVQKRPDYTAYQATTNRFFPWFPRGGGRE